MPIIDHINASATALRHPIGRPGKGKTEGSVHITSTGTVPLRRPRSDQHDLASAPLSSRRNIKPPCPRRCPRSMKPPSTRYDCLKGVARRPLRPTPTTGKGPGDALHAATFANGGTDEGKPGPIRGHALSRPHARCRRQQALPPRTEVSWAENPAKPGWSARSLRAWGKRAAPRAGVHATARVSDHPFNSVAACSNQANVRW